jgi:hypothetical protein
MSAPAQFEIVAVARAIQGQHFTIERGMGITQAGHGCRCKVPIVVEALRHGASVVSWCEKEFHIENMRKFGFQTRILTHLKTIHHLSRRIHTYSTGVVVNDYLTMSSNRLILATV